MTLLACIPQLCPTLADIAGCSLTAADNTYQLDNNVNVVFEDNDGNDIFILYEADKAAEFTGRVGIKGAGLSYPSFDTGAYFQGYTLRIVGDSEEYSGVGFYIQNQQVNGYTEFKAINDPAVNFASFTMGIGGSQTADQYQNVAYFYANENADSLLFQAAKSNGYVRFDAGGSDNEKMRITPSTVVINENSEDDYDFRVEGAANTHLLFTDGSADRVGINDSTPDGKLDIIQSSTTAAIPVVELEQLDLSEEFFNFVGTVGVGNPIEAVGSKTLTVTHFFRVAQNGSFLYLPAGTIA